MSAVALFADWCAAHRLHRDDLDETVLLCFLEEVPLAADSARQLRTVLFPQLRHPTDRSTVRGGGDWLAAEEGIRRCPIRGRAGVRGRRDAFVLTALDLGFTRRDVVSMTCADLDTSRWTLSGRPIPVGPDPVTCPRCVTARWMRVAHEMSVGTRAGAATVAVDVAGHDCARPASPRWVARVPLTPGLDRHGWVSDRPLSRRAITRVVTSRLDPYAAEPGRSQPRPVPTHGVDTTAALTQMQALLDDLDAKLAAVEAQSPGVTSPGWDPRPQQ